MTEIEDLKIQVERLRAMVFAQQNIIAALFADSGNQDEVIRTFDDLHSADFDRQHFEPVPDSEIDDLRIAHDFLRDYLTKTSSWNSTK